MGGQGHGGAGSPLTGLLLAALAAVRAVLDAAGLEPPPDLAAFVAEYDAANPRGAHGSHSYAPSDFGLDAVELRERFAGT